MRVALIGSPDWDDYNDFIRQVTLFIQDSHEVGHEAVTFVHSGKRGAENMITEYIGKTSRFLRQKNFKLKEELLMDKDGMGLVRIIESGIDFALIFSTGDKRTHASKKLLEAYNIPFRKIESD